MKIQTFRTRFGERSLREHAMRNPSSLGLGGMPTDSVNGAIVLRARVNCGRWIVDCPTLGCNGAELAFGGGFFCCECRNFAHGGNLLAVKYPAERAAIEKSLEMRLDKLHQTIGIARAVETLNWDGETVDELHVETEKLTSTSPDLIVSTLRAVNG